LPPAADLGDAAPDLLVDMVIGRDRPFRAQRL
jgi:hypothetical protein